LLPVRCREFKTALAPPYIAQVDARNHSEGGPRGIVIGTSLSHHFE
jgi:hypothetical protein